MGMNKIKYKTISALLFLIVIIMLTPAVFAGDVNDADDLNSANPIDTCSIANENSFQDLQNMIGAADEGSTVYLTGNYIYDDTFTSEGINISKSITIEGNSFTIDGLNKSRIFNVFAKNVVLNNITFANGHSEDGGAVIFNNYVSKSKITNCNFIDNIADNMGGAVYFASYSMDVVLDNLKFINNMASYGGAVMFDGAVVNATINRSVFRNNVVSEPGFGGAIGACNLFVDSIISNSNFTSNSAQYDGGAVYLGSEVSGCAFNNNRFVDNSARYSGGGIYVYYSNHNNFTDSYFANNSANMGGGMCLRDMSFFTVLDHLDFIDNHAKDSAGGLYIYCGCENSVIQNINFINNSGHLGGAFNILNYVVESSFKNITSINNSAVQSGAINFNLPVYDSEFDNLIFINNSADDMGGAIYFEEMIAGCSFNNFKFINNSAERGGAFFVRVDTKNNIFSNFDFINNHAVNGSAFYAHGIIRNNLFDNINLFNNVAENAGTFYFEYYMTIDNVFTGSLFQNNVANQGSALYFEVTSDETTLSNADFINNTAYLGSLIYYTDGTVNLINCRFYNNTGNNTDRIQFDPYMNVTMDDSITFGEILNASVDLPEDASGIITVSVDGNEVLELKVKKSTIFIPLENLTAGTHLINITYSGSYYYLPASSITEVIVNKKKTSISAYSISFNVTDVKSVNAILKTSDDVVADRLVTMIVDGKSYDARTDDNGVARFTIQLTKDGKYPALIKFDGDSIYAPSSKDIMITVVGQIIPDDNDSFAPGYKVTKSFKAQLKIVKLTIFGKDYFAVMDDDGIARFTIELDDGSKYEIAVEFVDDSPNDLFKLTIGDEIYTEHVDSNGIAKFDIAFPNGTEEVIVEFA